MRDAGTRVEADLSAGVGVVEAEGDFLPAGRRRNLEVADPSAGRSNYRGEDRLIRENRRIVNGTCPANEAHLSDAFIRDKLS